MISSYNFSVDLAVKYGVDESIVLTNLIFWLDKNKANEHNFHDGYYWTYNSMRAFAKQYPFWSEKQMRRILNSLEKQGAILTGNYNKIAYDRTKWYTVTEEAINTYLNRNNDLPKWSNGNEEKVEPIPYINPDVKPNNICLSDDKTIDSKDEMSEIIESIWKLYPRKEGRKDAFKKIPKLIKQYGKEQIEMCVRRYDLKVYTEKIPKKYIQMGSTFFNSGYMDYLDEYYKQEDNAEIKEKIEIKEEIEQPKQPKKQEKTIKLEEMF